MLTGSWLGGGAVSVVLASDGLLFFCSSVCLAVGVLVFLRMVDGCFKKCVPRFHDAELNTGEQVCVDRCIAKYMDVRFEGWREGGESEFVAALRLTRNPYQREGGGAPRAACAIPCAGSYNTSGGGGSRAFHLRWAHTHLVREGGTPTADGVVAEGGGGSAEHPP